MEKQTVTAIKIRANQEPVPVEDLLMKLALATQTLTSLSRFINDLDERGELASSLVAPDEWAVTGAVRYLDEIGSALKVLCWGNEAHKHL
jgi:hypothetical protein